jgi:hypothetical protein
MTRIRITTTGDINQPVDDDAFPTFAHRQAIHRAYDGFQNAIIDRIAHDAGCTRAEVLAILDTPLTAPEGAVLN